jgi:hypothetical protein
MKDRQDRPNPFIFKTPVRGSNFFGRGDLLTKIFEYINAGESVSLVGERRAGKTSILLCVLDQQQQRLCQPNQHILAFLDFLGLSDHTEAEIWITLLGTLVEEMAHVGLKTESVTEAIEQLRSGSLIQPTLLALFRSLADEGVRVTLLFDEFEATAQRKNPVDLSFYKILRNLAIDGKTRLSYVIATRQELSEVERSIEQRFTALSSPLFNIFHQLVVTPFSEDEAREMVSGLLQSAALDLATKLSFWLQRNLLFKLSGFHPFFLQIACYQLFEHCVLPDGTFSDRIPEDEIASAFLREASSYFSYYWEVATDAEREVMRRLAMNQDNLDLQAINSLRNRGLVIRDDNAISGWRLFSSAFATWTRAEEVRRLESLYARGMSYLAKQQWQEAIEILKPLGTLGSKLLGIDISAPVELAQLQQQHESILERILLLKEQKKWTEVRKEINKLEEIKELLSTHRASDE